MKLNLATLKLSIVAMLIAISGCSFFENEQSVPEEIEGEWTWYRTVGGWGQVVDADTVDYTMTLKIYSHNRADWFKNDSLIQKYTIQEGADDWVEGDLVMYELDDDNSLDCGLVIRYMPEKQELHLPTAHCTDSPTFYFTRGNIYFTPE